MTKHEAIYQYLNPYVETIVSGPLGFNFTSDQSNQIGVLTQYADKDIKKYVRVGAIREYGFQINISQPYSRNTDDINLLAMELAQGFNDWIDSQQKIKNYPDFGDKCQVQKIEALQNMPNLAGMDEKMEVAYYMLQCKITYFEKY